MTETFWHYLPFLGVSLLLGGVIGAFLHAVIAPYFNYKPVVAKRVDILPQYEALDGLGELRSQLLLSNGETSHPYTNLFTVQLEVTNESTQNFDAFTLGIALDHPAVLINIEANSPDRYHRVKALTHLTFVQPPSQMDVSLNPFNRTDTYKLRLLIVTSEGYDSLSSKLITLSSPEVVRFVSLPGTEEILKTAAKSISLPLGPFKLSFR